MKKFFTIAAFTLSLVVARAQSTEYVITGTAPKTAKTVYYYINDNYKQQDSVAVNKGNFQLKGRKPLNAFITIWTDRKTFVAVINDRTPITVNLNTNTVTGSAQNVQFSLFQKKQKDRNEDFEKIYREWKKQENNESIEAVTKKKTLEKQMDYAEKQRVRDIAQFCSKHTGDMLPAYFISENSGDFEYTQLEALLNPSYAYTSHPMLIKTKKKLESMALRRPGLKYTDLEMKDMEGKTVKLSQWVGKGNYVLVDFWASWCGPCRMEMPNVVDSYKRYHAARGYEVIGVSFDSRAQDWKKAVKDLDMEWPQMSDLKGWNSAAVSVYGVRSIPSNILIDPQGNIIAADLRGNNLTNKLKEIFGY